MGQAQRRGAGMGRRGPLLALLAAVATACLACCARAELLMVQTLTRHGERAPDKVVAKESCQGVWPKPSAIKKDFMALPGRLTPLGVQRMRDVGAFVRERYIEGFHWKKQDEPGPKGFLQADYQTHPEDWDFVAREGYRQQRSMAAISLGIFPNEPVPITVQPRLTDPVLGGPAPACGSRTAKMIVDWHKDKGAKMLSDHWDVAAAFENICQVNLTGNPVNAKPGGPNPHAWIGDISDSLDSAFACGVELPKEITPELHDQLTRLAFALQEGSHYDDPKGAIMFAGAFPKVLLSDFEAWTVQNNTAKRPKKAPRIRMYSCSRELMYGLEHLFDWETTIPNQPTGRVTSGTTFIWELHLESDLLEPSRYGLVVRSYWWTPGMQHPRKLQEDVALTTFRKSYEDYVSLHGGTWEEICDLEHFNPAHNHHEDSDFVNPVTVPKDHADEDSASDSSDSSAQSTPEPAEPQVGLENETDVAELVPSSGPPPATNSAALIEPAEPVPRSNSSHAAAWVLAGLVALSAVGAVVYRRRQSESSYRRI